MKVHFFIQILEFLFVASLITGVFALRCFQATPTEPFFRDVECDQKSCMILENERAPPPYPGNGDGNTAGGYGANFQTEYSQQGGYQYGGQAPMAYPPPNQPYIQQQQQMGNTVVVGGVGGMPGMYQTAPQDYTTQAWIACLCCFWPTGLLAIMKASESRDALARGDLVGANVAANSARQMVKISYIVGIISVVFSVVIIGVYFGIIMSSINSYN